MHMQLYCMRKFIYFLTKTICAHIVMKSLLGMGSSECVKA